jgi:hypothetical protein
MNPFSKEQSPMTQRAVLVFAYFNYLFGMFVGWLVFGR